MTHKFHSAIVCPHSNEFNNISKMLPKNGTFGGDSMLYGFPQHESLEVHYKKICSTIEVMNSTGVS